MKSILVVDDMAVFREPIAASLRLAGYKTLCAADGEEALQSVRAHRPDLILLDVSMPKMDGITFLRRLRADPSLAAIDVILLTAVSEKQYIVAAATLGVKNYLLKSRFRLCDLLDRVKKLTGAGPGAAASSEAIPSLSVTGQPHAAAPSAGEPATLAAAAAAPFNTSAPAVYQPPNGSPAASGAPAAPSPPRATAVNAPPKGLPAPTDKEAIPRLMTREQFLERVQEIFQAKSLSGVITEVIALASSPRGDRTQLAALIAQDPMLAARVLHAANSAAYASAGASVTTIPDAIRKVGFSSVRNIAAALGVFDCMPEGGVDGFNPIRCWQHSFAVAQLCERLAVLRSPEQAGVAYLIGLCHDLGDIFVRTQFNKEYNRVLETAARTGLSFQKLHQQMLGISAARLIGAVLKCMALPQAIREPIEILHAAGGYRIQDPMTRILWMAENFANAALLASGPRSEVAPLPQSFCLAAVGNQNPPRPDPAALRSEVMGLSFSLPRLSRADEEKIHGQMFKRHSTRVWVARDPRISEFDPIGLAMQSLAKAEIYQRLPTAAEAEEIDRLVVITVSANTPGLGWRDIESALAKTRAAGKSIPAIAFAADAASVGHRGADIAWRTSAPICDLAAFAELPEADQRRQAAA
jgi:CheY-like chemotaxis protein/HD-like signal output (HDOD) protein